MTDRTCSVPGCEKPPRHRMCDMHAARLARHGDVNALRPNARGRFVQAGPGYIKLTGSSHPLAVGGSVFEHRAVLYDAIGPGAHQCHWCQREIHWNPQGKQLALEADHLDANKTNNAPGNLVPSCQACNKSRREHYKTRWTHCPNGHEYTPDNLVPGLPHRKCLTCRRKTLQRYEARRRSTRSST